MTKQEAKLLTCPFCGGQVSIALTGYELYNWLFITRGNSSTEKNCKCRLFMESEKWFIGSDDHAEQRRKAKSNLINAWNTRALIIGVDWGAEAE